MNVPEAVCRIFLMFGQICFKKKVTEKSDRKKVTEKTQAHYDMILSFMEEDKWYKASELVDVLGVKETRTKALLRALVKDEFLVDNGAIKGRKYKKV